MLKDLFTGTVESGRRSVQAVATCDIGIIVSRDHETISVDRDVWTSPISVKTLRETSNIGWAGDLSATTLYTLHGILPNRSCSESYDLGLAKDPLCSGIQICVTRGTYAKDDRPL